MHCIKRNRFLITKRVIIKGDFIFDNKLSSSSAHINIIKRMATFIKKVLDIRWSDEYWQA